MTRLKSSDLKGMSASLATFDLQLRRQTGRDLGGVAAHALGCDSNALTALASPPRVGVVRLTCGKGAIPGFTDTVAGIAGHLGAHAFVAGATDAAGLAEVCEQGAEIVMMADDERFVAINLASRRVSDNSVMTGKGFAAALDLMAAGLQSKTALVLGCGPVGRAAAAALAGFGARVTVFDLAADRSRALADDILKVAGTPIKVAEDLYSVLASHTHILDATPAGAFIPTEVVTPETVIAAPGVPCGVKSAAMAELGERLLFDSLRIGVASMLMDSLQEETIPA